MQFRDQGATTAARLPPAEEKFSARPDGHSPPGAFAPTMNSHVTSHHYPPPQSLNLSDRLPPISRSQDNARVLSDHQPAPPPAFQDRYGASDQHQSTLTSGFDSHQSSGAIHAGAPKDPSPPAGPSTTAAVTIPSDSRYYTTTAPLAITTPSHLSNSRYSSSEATIPRATSSSSSVHPRHEAHWQRPSESPSGLTSVSSQTRMDHRPPVLQHHPHYPDHYSLPPSHSNVPLGQHHNITPVQEHFPAQQHLQPQHTNVSHGPSPSYAQHYAPSQQYPGQHYGQQSVGYSNGLNGKRRSARATQACEQCRTRKQKCDEGRPCSFCAKENYDCNYREATLPKPGQDRSTSMLMESIVALQNSMHVMQQGFQVIADRIGCTIPQDGDIVPGVKRKSESLHDSRDEMSPRGNKILSPMRDVHEAMEDGTSGSNEAPQSRQVSPGVAEQNAPEATGPAMKSEQLAPDAAASGIEELPFDHTTSVAHLKQWPEIKQLYLQAGVADSPSISAYEKTRGRIRAFGVGEDKELPLPAASPASSIQSLPEVRRRQLGLAAPSPESEDRYEKPELDRTIFPSGSLNLDKRRVERLSRIYFERVHKLMPFIDPDRVDMMRTNFIRKYSFLNKTATYAGPATIGEDSPMSLSSTPAPADRADDLDYRRHPESEGRPVAYSVSDALILLLLANGRIADHRTQLLPFVGSPKDRYPMAAPSRSYRAKSSSASPAASSGTSLPSPATTTSGPHRYPTLNIDIVPGLAYFGTGVDALKLLPDDGYHVSVSGNHQNLLHLIWANLLAALYLGQLVRVRESYDHVLRAADYWKMLRREFDDSHLKDPLFKSQLSQQRNLNKHHDKNINLVRAAYWTIIQMESDMRAECEFVETGLGIFAAEIADPRIEATLTSNTVNDLAHPERQLNMNDVQYSFQLQNSFRRLLNQTQSIIYNKTREWPINPKDDSAESINDSFTRLREIIVGNPMFPAYTDWSEEDPRSGDVNVARARGKYYGGRYLIHRLFLLIVMRWKRKQAPAGAFDEQIGPDGPFADPLPRPDQLQDNLTLSMSTGDQLDDDKYDDEVKRAWLRCARSAVHAALQSTIVFDGLFDLERNERLFVTNIHGTSTAQYGNMLVVTATYLSWLAPLVPIQKFMFALRRTIKLLWSLSHMSEIMEIHARVLEVALERVKEKWAKIDPTACEDDSNEWTNYHNIRVVKIKSADSSFGP